MAAGKAIWARTTATMETPVWLRAWVLAIMPPAYGERSPPRLVDPMSGDSS